MVLDCICQYLANDTVEQWSFKKYQAACWKSSRISFLPPAEERLLGRPEGWWHSNSAIYIPAVFSTWSARISFCLWRSSHIEPFVCLGLSWQGLESPLCLCEGWESRWGAPWCVRVSSWLDDLDQLCSKAGACLALALHVELHSRVWSIFCSLKGLFHALGVSRMCPLYQLLLSHPESICVVEKPEWKRAGKLRSGNK